MAHMSRQCSLCLIKCEFGPTWAVVSKYWITLALGSTPAKQKRHWQMLCLSNSEPRRLLMRLLRNSGSGGYAQLLVRPRRTGKWAGREVPGEFSCLFHCCRLPFFFPLSKEIKNLRVTGSWCWVLNVDTSVSLLTECTSLCCL